MDEAAAQGLKLEYKLFDFAALKMDVPDLPVFLEALQASGYAGINVTHPYKQAVIPLLDELSESARRVGAVNTIAFVDGRRIGHNTDVTGFAESFRRGLPGADVARVFQAGAGGAGAAVATALLDLGTQHLLIFDPQADRAAALVDQLTAAYGPDRASVSTDPAADAAAACGIVNATPIGMAEHPGTPVPEQAISPAHWVADIVYFPLQTALLATAGARGCRVLDGGGMAVFQAAGAFEIFTGAPADRERMRGRFLEGLAAPCIRS
jgi:shikimate dehydrogenase